jgi:hypothetical protein
LRLESHEFQLVATLDMNTAKRDTQFDPTCAVQATEVAAAWYGTRVYQSRHINPGRQLMRSPPIENFLRVWVRERFGRGQPGPLALVSVLDNNAAAVHLSHYAPWARKLWPRQEFVGDFLLMKFASLST